MSHPICRLLACICTLLVGCAPPVGDAGMPSADTGGIKETLPSAEGWTADPESPGTAWSWGGGEVRLSVAGGDSETRTRGIWIERNDHALGSPFPSGQRVPLLIATPRTDGTPVLRAMEGDRIVLSLDGSTEHGCPVDALDVSIDVDPWTGGIVILASGVPYLMLDANPVLVVEEERPLQAVLPPPGEDWTSDSVTRLIGTSGGWPVRIGFPAAPPWLQLQRHGASVEVDLDHSCEQAGFDRALMSIRIPA